MENKKLVLDVHERPKLSQWLILSIQHVLAMFGATVLVPILTGLPISCALIGSGIGTLFYILVTKGKSPVYLGSSFAYIAPISSALALGVATGGNPNYGAVMGGLVMVGAVYVAIALIIKLIGTKWINKILPPVVVGSVIMVIGLGLAPSAVGMATEHIVVALATLLTAIIVSTYAKGILKLLPIVCAIIVGYLTSMAFGLVDFTPVLEASWFEIPNFAFLHSKPVFSLEIAMIMIPVAIVTIAEHIGDHLTLGSIIGKDLTKMLHRTLIGDGVATAIGGLLGAPANTTYGENTGVIGLTKVASVHVIALAGVIATCLGFIGKFTALIQTIPNPVIGGMSLLLYGIIASSGMRVLINNKVDLGKQRNLIICAVILVVGIGGLSISLGQITLSGMALCAIIGIVLNLILPYEKKCECKHCKCGDENENCKEN